ncbi:MAG TPA: D-2-hydroxyacid dehydrogenase family protein [Casimicrobiaceae bacterium]|jgi:phosphoglycerate dehydrogenase-like enzyme|nr:D-2-hydroxyacid dehydrogenase family protein [Casimicrobiaceae bacterium]
MTRIAVLDDWQRIARVSADWTPLMARAEVAFFEAPFVDEDDAARGLAAFEIVLATRERTPFPPSLVARLPRLKMFGLTGSRAALIDIAGMISRGITVCYTGGGPSGSSTAELTLGLLLAAARRIPAGDAAVRAGRFQEGTEAGPLLDGKTIGLIGLGRIGARMAAYCRALGMKVLAWSQNLTDEAASAAGARRVSKEDLLSAADVVSLHLVLSERTRGILGATDLARMKAGAILVNTARAPLVDEAALVAAVQSGRIIAALDVFHREPLPVDHPLTRATNAVLTPHLGYGVIEVYREYYQQSVENALAFLDGNPIRVFQSAGG